MPATLIECPSCKAPLRVATPLTAGRLVKCPHCAKTFPVSLQLVATARQRPSRATPSQPAPPRPALPQPKSAQPAIHKLTCPKCATTLRTSSPLPPGRLSKCPKCATVFRVPGASVKPKPPLADSRAPAKPQAPVADAANSPAAAPFTWVKCPKCRTVLRLPGMVPAGKSVKCGQCTTVFLVPPKQTRLEPSRVTTLAKPEPQPNGAPPRPVLYLDCPGCRTALKLTGKLPLGQSLKCPKCARPLRLSPKKPAARTKLVRTAAQKTKLATGPARKTKLAAGPAGKTKLAHAVTKKTALAPGAVPPVPSKAAAAPASRAVAASSPPAKLEAPPRRLRIKIIKAGLYLALAGVVAALGVVGAGLFGYGPLAPDKGEISSSAWQEFAPPGGRCRVSLPGEPRRLKASPKGIGGADAHNYVVSWKDDAEFSLSFWDRPAAQGKKDTLKDLGETVEERLREALEGIVIKRTDISLNGHAGREWVIEPANGGTLIARLYQAKGSPGDRYYVLLAGGARLKPGTGSAAQFFDSFRIE